VTVWALVVEALVSGGRSEWIGLKDGGLLKRKELFKGRTDMWGSGRCGVGTSHKGIRNYSLKKLWKPTAWTGPSEQSTQRFLKIDPKRKGGLGRLSAAAVGLEKNK